LKPINYIIALSLLTAGCLQTTGTLEIRGKVVDEITKETIPGRGIIIKALVGKDENKVAVDAGKLSTDSSGYFTYTLQKEKDAFYYDFCIVGDSDYVFRTVRLGLEYMENNAKFLSFSLSKLVGLTVKVFRKSSIPECDTLDMTLETDRIDGRLFHPYRIENYGLAGKFAGRMEGVNIVWTGGQVNSALKARVYANRLTRLSWRLWRNGSRKEFTDTITCRRNSANIIYFSY
jgi:hypothetical protein